MLTLASSNVEYCLRVRKLCIRQQAIKTEVEECKYKKLS